MNRLNQNLHDVSTGWAINIYGSDRRLLCTLDPSHAWVFVAGILLGALLMVGGMESSATPSPQPEVDNSAAPAPLAID